MTDIKTPWKADPVNVWVAYDGSGSLRLEFCDITEADVWMQLCTSKFPQHRMESLGWTVRPMRLLDGHGEQAFDPKLFDTVREIVKFRGYYVDEKLRTASITTELIFETLGLPLPNASSELGEQEVE
jgi:hypothetical protein